MKKQFILRYELTIHGWSPEEHCVQPIHQICRKIINISCLLLLCLGSPWRANPSLDRFSFRAVVYDLGKISIDVQKRLNFHSFRVHPLWSSSSGHGGMSRQALWMMSNILDKTYLKCSCLSMSHRMIVSVVVERVRLWFLGLKVEGPNPSTAGRLSAWQLSVDCSPFPEKKTKNVISLIKSEDKKWGEIFRRGCIPVVARYLGNTTRMKY